MHDILLIVFWRNGRNVSCFTWGRIPTCNQDRLRCIVIDILGQLCRMLRAGNDPMGTWVEIKTTRASNVAWILAPWKWIWHVWVSIQFQESSSKLLSTSGYWLGPKQIAQHHSIAGIQKDDQGATAADPLAVWYFYPPGNSTIDFLDPPTSLSLEDQLVDPWIRWVNPYPHVSTSYPSMSPPISPIPWVSPRDILVEFQNPQILTARAQL